VYKSSEFLNVERTCSNSVAVKFVKVRCRLQTPNVVHWLHYMKLLINSWSPKASNFQQSF